MTLGGWGLALAGSACLWTWPTSVFEVQGTLRDATPINSREVLDDSAYRGTVGGCCATTLGSVVHELGHCFDLGHTESEIMERGFDQLDMLLTVGEAAKVVKQSCGRRLAPCGGEVDLANDDQLSASQPSALNGISLLTPTKKNYQS